MKNIAVGFSVGGILTHYCISLISHKDFELNTELNDFLTFGNMVMSVTAEARLRIQDDEKFAFRHSKDYISPSFSILMVEFTFYEPLPEHKCRNCT